VNENSKVFSIPSVLIIFSAASLVLFLETHFLIPYLSDITGLDPVIFWFAVAGLGMFLPLILAAVYFIKSEGLQLNRSTWTTRMRFRKLKKGDWIWALAGIVLIGAISFTVMKVIETYTHFNVHPPFMSFDPLTPDKYWILLLWLPYWILNIMGEEILWRGVLLPGQEKVSGKYAWIINGAGWAIFHIAFGWQLLLTMMPILFILPYIVQKTKNSWTGVIIHAAVNGPSFIAIALGVM
jgi:membrane protease YdiL (CAAX protease family)